MKSFFKNILFLIILLCPLKVFAAGNIWASKTSITLEVGNSTTFNISAYNTIGDVSIASNNSNIAAVDKSEWSTGMVDEGQTKSGSVTITARNVGTATITLTLDAATFDGEDLAGQRRTITVNVIEKKIVNNNSNKSNNSNKNDIISDTRSKNNNLKSLEVEGFQVDKLDNQNYALTVSYDISNINLKVEAEDSKATITGMGSHELQIGENNIETVITSESGIANKIILKVTRKDRYYLDDLNRLLDNSDNDNLEIFIDSSTILEAETINNIKNSKKVVSFNYMEEDVMRYSWIIDGTKITDIGDFNTKVNFSTDYLNDIIKASNYSEGLYVNVENVAYVPNDTILKLYVGNKYSSSDKLNIYSYNKDLGFKLNNEQLDISDGYVEIKLDDNNDYFITMATIDLNDNIQEDDSNIEVVTLTLCLAVLEVLFALSVIAYFVIRKIKNKNAISSK